MAQTIIEEVTSSDYKYGWSTSIETETVPKGLSEETVRLISGKKNEPEWLLEYRLKAFRHWQKITRTFLGSRSVPTYRFSGNYLLCCTKTKTRI